MAERLEQDFEARELGRLLNSLVVLINKLSDHNPDLVSEILRHTLPSIELDKCGVAARTVVLQLKEAALDDPGLSARLKPAAIGGYVNTGLASFNRFSQEKPDLVARGLAGTMSALDGRELSTAVNSLVSQVVDAALENPDILKSVIKPLVSGVLRFLKGSIKNLKVFKRFRK